MEEMSLEEAIVKLSNYCSIFRNTQQNLDEDNREIYGDIIGVEEIKAIEKVLNELLNKE